MRPSPDVMRHVRRPRGKLAHGRSLYRQAPLAALITAGVACGTVASTAFHFWQGHYLHLGYPHNSFFFRPGDRFMDYFNSYQQARAFQPTRPSTLVYSPLLHLVMTVLGTIPASIGLSLLVALFLVLYAATIGLALGDEPPSTTSRVMHILMLTLLAYPVLFVLDRGNLEMLVFVLLAAFFHLHYARDSRWAWLPLALAIAAKYYWFSLVVLLLIERRFGRAAAAAAGAVGVTLAAALVLTRVSHTSLASILHAMVATLSGHVDMEGALWTTRFSHSLWGWVLVFDRWSAHGVSGTIAVRLGYLAFAAGVLGLVVTRLTAIRREPWQAPTAILACTLLLPFENTDYTLIHLALVLVLFLATAARDRRAWVATALFMVLMVPTDYVFFSFRGRISEISISLFISSLALAGLLVCALVAAPGPGECPELRRLSAYGRLFTREPSLLPRGVR